jgi:hypothetical protein
MAWKTKEEEQAYSRKYYQQHREQYIKRSARYRENGGETILAKKRQYARQHKDENRERQKKWAAKNGIHIKDKQLQKYYGITFEQMQQMYIAQGGVCAIHKGKFINSKDMHVDHNHTTGQVRQLLCSKCNNALGLFQESPEIMMQAIEYVNKWNT